MSKILKKLTVTEDEVVLVLPRHVAEHIVATYEWVAAEVDDLDEMACWYGMVDWIKSFL